MQPRYLNFWMDLLGHAIYVWHPKSNYACLSILFRMLGKDHNKYPAIWIWDGYQQLVLVNPRNGHMSSQDCGAIF